TPIGIYTIINKAPYPYTHPGGWLTLHSTFLVGIIPARIRHQRHQHPASIGSGFHEDISARTMRTRKTSPDVYRSGIR
ncbi:MAG: hypothetical protein M0Z65_12715, partial [Firmicutes bacterium]|nr:hypothetical protein [Bacillota bacterium]